MTQGTLAGISVPEGWEFRPLWAVAPRVVEKGFPQAEPLSVFLGDGVVPRSQRADNHNELGADLSAYLHVMPGDLVFNKLRTWQGGLGVSAHEGIVSPAYFVCRPDASVWPRYLHYLLTSAPYRAELTRLSKWMPPSQFDIPWEMLRSVPLLLPPREEQRRIADFLDHQVALLGRAVALRKQQAALLRERHSAYLAQQYAGLAETYGVVRLGLRLRGLEQGWSPQCEDRPAGEGEYGVVKAGCVNGGVFRAGEHKALPSDVSPRLEYLLKPRDLLMSRANGSLDLIGSIATVPGDAPKNLILCDKVYRLALDDQTDVEFVAHMLRSHQIREAIKLGTSGAEGMANNLPSGTVRALLLPAAPMNAQVRVANELSQRGSRLDQAIDLMQRSVTLLEERKQALITAAVAGVSDVTTARSAA